MVMVLHCPVCCSLLKEEIYNMPGSEIPGRRYVCALDNENHYIGYLDESLSSFEEETVVVVVNNRRHSITQYNYHPTYDVVIVVMDEEGNYAFSKELYFSEPPFDFLHKDLDLNIKRLKTILTFR